MIEAPPGLLLGRYERLEPLGAGGFGMVYAALDHKTGEQVALKELSRIDPRAMLSFKREFRAVQEVHHPNLVRLDSLFEAEHKWVIAMELVQGCDLLAHVYADLPDRNFDEPRLRESFLQLADGLEALHEAGFLHRDVKPANVRVTPEGRVVLLDFGLAMAVDVGKQTSRAAGLGTLAYMAPEQLAKAKLSPAADWYAYGACLYEALTGVLPIEADNPLVLFHHKQTRQAPRASTHVPAIPSDLDELCAALLALDPQARPGPGGVRVSLREGRLPSGRPLAGGTQPSPAPDFTGRDAELEQLEQAFERARAGQQPVLLIEGESGIGKSALVERFALAAPGRVVLRSRCHENELLAYKAFDGAIDAIGKLLNELDREQCERLLPPRAGLLRRLFPALAGVRALEGNDMRGAAGGAGADPSLLRVEAFAVFAKLIASLSERTPLVFAIDDLQWADAESFRLLHAWLDAPPTRCLVLATVRPRAELEGDAAAGIAKLRERACVSEIVLSGLPPASALAMARQLMSPALPLAWAERIAHESGGHPLFLTVLARHAESFDPTSLADLSLDAAIAARLGGLSRQARSLVATIALLESAQPIALCGRAAKLDELEIARTVTELCRQKLLRRRRAGEIECFHDRIRRVALAKLPPPQIRALHAQVAAALASAQASDPAEIARHHEAAGEPLLAYAAYRVAAERAAAALAFGRAQLLFDRALQLCAQIDVPAAERGALHERYGQMLGHDGRSAEAAAQYIAAAETASGDAQTRLRVAAAQHLLQGVRVDEGMATARGLLHQLGVALPAHPAAALARLAWDRTCLRLSGLQPRSKRAPDASTTIVLDALWSLTMPISWVDPIASAVLNARHARLALADGAPADVARALAQEAFSASLRDADAAKARALLERARALCQELDEPLLDVAVAFHEGTVALNQWDMPRACERLEHAYEVGAGRCSEHPWLLTNVCILLGAVWSWRGQHARLASTSDAWLAQARQRGDRFALSLLETTAIAHLRHLMADDVEGCERALEHALQAWPREPFTFVHFGEINAVAHRELYRGGDGALRWFEREQPRLAASMLLKAAPFKIQLLLRQACAILAARRGADRASAVRLLQSASAKHQQLRKLAAPLELSQLLDAQLHALGGDAGAALELARAARAQAEQSGCGFVATSARYLEGVLEGGDAGASQRAAASAFFASEGWQRPRRALGIYCPALDELEGSA